MKKQHGFTLIELLLVLAIIGIISAIAIPALLGQRERAKAKAVQANVDAVAAECIRINDSAKENNKALTADLVVSAVLALSNYSSATAKNPYDGTAGYAATGTQNGLVKLVGGAVADSATGQSYSAVTITGYYLQGGANKSMIKVAGLD